MKITGATKVHLQLSFADREESLALITSELADAYEALRRFNPQDVELPEILVNIQRAQIAITAVNEKYLALMDVVRTNSENQKRSPLGDESKSTQIVLANEEEEDEDSHTAGDWSPLPGGVLEVYAHKLLEWMNITDSFEDAVAFGAAYLVTRATLEKRRPNPIRQNVAGLVLMALLRKLGIRYFAPSKGELVPHYFILLMRQQPIIKDSDYAIRQPLRTFRNISTAPKLPVQKKTVVNPGDPDDVETVFSYPSVDAHVVDNEIEKSDISLILMDQIADQIQSRFDVEETDLYIYSQFAHKFDRNINELDADPGALPATFA